MNIYNVKVEVVVAAENMKDAERKIDSFMLRAASEFKKQYDVVEYDVAPYEEYQASL